ncbi:MAG TPA: methyltransferase domain-containing protein [Micavibrio sp.]|nr:methyltransferase domain-containing protein [Micavibrio sp.]
MIINAVQDDYRALAESYDKRWGKFSNLVHGWVMQRLDRPASVLDLGCGTGKLLSLIHARFPMAMLQGIDASREMLEQAYRQGPSAVLTQGDINDFSLIRTLPNAVICLNVLHHLDDPGAFIQQLSSYSKAQGCSDIFLCDFALDGLAMKAAALYWRRKQESFSKGYSSEALRSVLGHYFTIADEEILRPDRFWRLQIYHLKT